MSYNPENRTPLSKSTKFVSGYSQKLQISLTFPSISPYTRQEFKDECDINTIMAQYQHTGELPHINEQAPQYLDCTGEDFRTHMDYIAGAFSLFEELPAKIRDQFDNDPAEFLDFCSQEKNRPELAAMGLLRPDLDMDAPTPVGVTPTTAKAAKNASQPIDNQDAPTKPEPQPPA